ncbi:MAG: DUF599 domain-containing protein [Aquabacterium sp.]|nr:DUF599 domain-containing protein [Aquabacterium sp.]
MNSMLPTDIMVWLAEAATLLIVLAYELIQRRRYQGKPEQFARSAHADLREAWMLASSEHPGAEIVAVQTLRNAMMSATLTATTATLGLMGAITLTATQLHATFGPNDVQWPTISPRLVMELLLMSTLFAALVCSTMAVRYFSHASFISAMPVGSAARRQWLPVGVAHVRQAGVLYSFGLRALLMVAPVVVSIVHPLIGPMASVGLVIVLWQMDRVTPLKHASKSHG